ncbi:protein dispatched homolog 3 [Ornithorhynchus anatinus]|uniref:Protein dispatched homolog 3 n=1 Tax=Ornithorhynchus anatinus TaxID=9258 RepID=A0A6I8NWI7_ORNAN|nr:protein dispatched homolog 3 [Ornithorhynchus anatinus]XP_028922533.1 protein dispatched homolog 3 [Ornithorhynchus anatinus]XP_028922535.1 protein dispatched homolog 3 [Ornithorhynchus anatinus]
MDPEDEPLLQDAWLDEEREGEEDEEEEKEEEEEREAAAEACHRPQKGGWGPELCGPCGRRPQTPPPRLPASGFWSALGWAFTNPYCASLVLFLGCAVPTALAALMFLRYPTLDIDISYNAFEIRNHEASQRFDALALALKSQFGSWGRNRRDLADFTSETLQRLISEQLQQLRLGNASHLGSSSRLRRGVPTSDPGGPLPPKARVTDPEKDDRWATPAPRGFSANRSRLSWVVTAPFPGREPANRRGCHPHCEGPPLRGWTANRSGRLRRGASRWDYSRAYVSTNTQAHAHWRIELIFLARGDAEKNIFTTERLVTIHDIERKIMDHPGFREFCWKPHEVLKDLPLGSYSYCSPPSSLMTYFFPTERGGKIYYDGMGQDLADIRGSLELAMTHPEFYWYVDEGLSAENMKSSLLRSEILFGAPLPNYYSVEDRWEEQRTKFQSFVVTYVAMLAKQSTSKVQVLYGGTDLFDYEVRRTFNNDMLLAFISSSCIAALVYILTSCSVFLSFFGIASIGLSCLVALFLYHVVFGIQYLGILNGVAAFVIVGIGVDDVFVFINTYRQATHLRDPQLRMIHTIQTAGKATFFTSLTTAAAYAANIFSQIPAVHDFGLFMSLIVSCCWLAVLFTMPAALGIWSLYVSPLESSCQASCQHTCGKKSSLHLAEDVFLTWDTPGGSSQSSMPYLDDDIPLLSVEEESASLEVGDVPLVSVLPENLQQPPERGGRGQLINQLQELLHQWVLWAAVKSRWVIVGLFVAILILSLFFASRLRPASRAPLLFRPDTNIQVLLDLKYNLSAEGISCVTCSGLFQEKPHNLQNNIRTSLEKKKRGSGVPWGSRSEASQQDPQGTVYISKAKGQGRPAIYRFSLNASLPAPWQTVSPGEGEVPSFQVYRVPFANFTKKLTACVSTVGLLQQTNQRQWMMTSLSCDTKRGWKFDFSFYVAAKEQQRTRKLYFAQSHKPPFHGRVCVAPPGCLLSSSPDGPNKGFLYVPSEKAPKVRLSATYGFNPCVNTGCGKPAVRPLVDTGAMVFVVFGILGVNRTWSSDNHVIGDMGSVIYDDSFDLFKEIGHLCRLCKAIASNEELVKPGGAQCLPSGYSISSFLQMLHPECKNIPEPNLLPGQLSHGAVGVKEGKVQWISMAFESTTYKGKSSFQTYADYLRWEGFLQQQLQLFPEGSVLRRGFQTCEHWKQIFMEIIGVQSALYGLVLSLLICVAAVAVFTTHILLLLPVLLSILGIVCLVVTIMYWSGWEMGAVEAISLSILVGSSVDYCVHLVEGYLLAGENLPLQQTEDPSSCRQWRTLEAIRHVGVAIVSSAVTTVIATVPLFFCIIAPFAKFGKIVALNTGVSIVYTLTVSTALLGLMGPATFTRTRTSFLKALGAVLLTGVLGLVIGLAFLQSGFKIPLPSGTTL